MLYPQVLKVRLPIAFSTCRVGIQVVGEDKTKGVECLKNKETTDSHCSSKPPSSDIHKRSEQQPSTNPQQGKHRAGAQPGHVSKTRQGFGRIDR